MKSVKEVSLITGITEQNIRYYERKGLLAPERNKKNSYREYSDEDVDRLKMILLFRKLDMPLADIKRLLEGSVTLDEAMTAQISRLESEKEKLDAALEFCGTIQESQLAELDVDSCLERIREKEREGSVFAKIAEDYTAVVKSEMEREFSFMPDAPCRDPREFTEELLKFADQENLNIVITKEGMSPRFMMDGIEYWAYRTSGRYGITVHCEMVHPEDYIPEGMSEKKYRRYRALSYIGIPVLIFFTANLWLFRELLKSWEGALMLAITVILYISEIYFVYYCYGKNFRG